MKQNRQISHSSVSTNLSALLQAELQIGPCFIFVIPSSPSHVCDYGVLKSISNKYLLIWIPIFFLSFSLDQRLALRLHYQPASTDLPCPLDRIGSERRELAPTSLILPGF